MAKTKDTATTDAPQADPAPFVDASGASIVPEAQYEIEVTGYVEAARGVKFRPMHNPYHVKGDVALEIGAAKISKITRIG